MTSGWLFGAMNGVNAAGPASIISWPLAGVMLLVIVMVFAEPGPTYPVAGGMARFAHYAFGGFGGYTVGFPQVGEVEITGLSGLGGRD